MKPSLSVPPLEKDIARLTELTRPALVELWQGQYRADPPKGLSRNLLVRAIAHGMQAKRCGGLTPATRRKLRSIANGQPTCAVRQATTRPRLQPGARLVREWNGATHTVEAVDNGFVWNDTHYRSLSAVARAITGARWSGPLFFGIRKAVASRCPER
jgi:hypothetical protein